MAGVNIVRGSILCFGASDIGSSVTTRFLFPGISENIAEMIEHSVDSPRVGLLRRLFVRHDTPAGNGTIITYRVLVNGVPSTLSAAMASTSSQVSNTSVSILIAAGDRLALEVNKAGSVGVGPRGVRASVEIV